METLEQISYLILVFLLPAGNLLFEVNPFRATCFWLYHLKTPGNQKVGQRKNDNCVLST